MPAARSLHRRPDPSTLASTARAIAIPRDAAADRFERLPGALAVAAALAALATAAQPVRAQEAAAALPSAETVAAVAAATGTGMGTGEAGAVDTQALTATQIRNLSTYQPWRSNIKLGLPGSIYGGKGVTVGIADTGVQTNHPMLSGRVVRTYNAINGSTDVTDRVGHGTHVSGLVAGTLANGALLAGVAPEASIAFAKVFPDSSSTSSTYVDRGVNWLVSTAKAPIISLSLGTNAPFAQTSIVNAVNAGTLVVAAAGNEGLANPGWPARFANQSWAKGQIIAVGAVDGANKIASFSNRAGDTASWYVVAPGVNIASAYPGSQYVYMSGTSMATPIVAGQAALIKGTWSYLTADKVAQIIFRTATDLGAAGVDSTYGWGLINVEKSMAPVGSLGITLDSSKKLVIAPLPSKTVAATGTTGGAATVKSQAFDEFGRNFTVDVGKSVSASSPLTLDSVFGPSDRLLSVADQTIAPGVRLTSFVDAPRFGQGGGNLNPSDVYPSTVRATMLSWDTQSTTGRRLQGALGTGGLGAYAFGLAASDLGASLQGAEMALSSPLLKFAGNHQFGAWGSSLGGGWGVRAGYASSVTPYVADQGNVAMLELTKQGAGWAFGIGYGTLAQPSVMGATQSLLGLAQSSRTQALSVSAARSISPNVTLAGTMHLARTDGLQAGGLLEGASAMQSAGFGVAAVWANALRERDRVSLSVSTPLRATSGTMRYTVIDSVDPNTGAARLASRDVSMRPTGWEKLVELRYVNPLSSSSSMSWSAAARFQPDHDPEARTQGLIAVRYNKQM